MKVQTAQIQAVILPNKKRPDGTCPVAIRVNFHGRAMRTLPVSVRERDWDAKSSAVRKTDPEYAFKNQIIADGLRAADQNRLALEAADKIYRAKDVLIAREKYTEPNLLEIGAICGRMLDERGVREHTRASYATAVKKLNEYYGPQCGLLDVDSDNIAGFGKWLVSNGYKNGTILTVMRCIATIWRYAVGHGLLADSDNPFKTYKYTKLFKPHTSREALTEAEMARMEGWYSRHFFVDDSGSVTPISADVWRDMTTACSPLCAVAMFLSSYYLQGLSTVDMALLRAEQFRERKTSVQREEMRAVQVVVDGLEQTAYIPSSVKDDVYFWEIVDVKRRKTGQPVPIALEIDNMTLAAIGLYLSTADERGGYVFPILDRTPDETELNRACERFSKNAQKHLRRLGKELGIAADITMYSARHSFATHLVNNGASAGLLASAMGRTVEHIDTYVHSIDATERLLAAKRR